MHPSLTRLSSFPRNLSSLPRRLEPRAAPHPPGFPLSRQRMRVFAGITHYTRASHIAHRARQQRFHGQRVVPVHTPDADDTDLAADGIRQANGVFPGGRRRSAEFQRLIQQPAQLPLRSGGGRGMPRLRRARRRRREAWRRTWRGTRRRYASSVWPASAAASRLRRQWARSTGSSAGSSAAASPTSLPISMWPGSERHRRRPVPNGPAGSTRPLPKPVAPSTNSSDRPRAASDFGHHRPAPAPAPRRRPAARALAARSAPVQVGATAASRRASTPTSGAPAATRWVPMASAIAAQQEMHAVAAHQQPVAEVERQRGLLPTVTLLGYHTGTGRAPPWLRHGGRAVTAVVTKPSGDSRSANSPLPPRERPRNLWTSARQPGPADSIRPGRPRDRARQVVACSAAAAASPIACRRAGSRTRPPSVLAPSRPAPRSAARSMATWSVNF